MGLHDVSWLPRLVKPHRFTQGLPCGVTSWIYELVVEPIVARWPPRLWATQATLLEVCLVLLVKQPVRIVRLLLVSCGDAPVVRRVVAFDL